MKTRILVADNRAATGLTGSGPKSSSMKLRGQYQDIDRDVRASPTDLAWKRTGDEWILYRGKRRTGIYRIALPSGRLSDLANLSWAKSLALEAAERELVYEASQHPPNAQ